MQFKRPCKAFSCREIRAASLSEATFYERAAKKLEAIYFGLVKGRPAPALSGGKDVKSVVNCLAAIGMEKVGLPSLIDWIEAERRALCANVAETPSAS